MRVIGLFAVSIAIACTSTTAASSTSQKSAQQKTPPLASNAGGPNAKGKFVCEYEDSVGTHFSQKVCRYRDEDEEQRARQSTQDAFNGAHGVNIRGQ
jgi:hypothetical protein